MKIKIDTIFVIGNEATFIIVEAEANHNRNFDMTKKLIDVVVGANVGVVKFKTSKAWDYVFHEMLNLLKNIMVLWARTFDPILYYSASIIYSHFIIEQMQQSKLIAKGNGFK